MTFDMLTDLVLAADPQDRFKVLRAGLRAYKGNDKDLVRLSLEEMIAVKGNRVGEAP